MPEILNSYNRDYDYNGCSANIQERREWDGRI